MAQIVEYTAPAQDLSYQPKMEGINALEGTSEQLRRVAWQEAQLGHQTAQSIKEGANQLDAGLTEYEKAAKKQKALGEKLADVRTSSDMRLKQQIEQEKALREADPLDLDIQERQRVAAKKERDDAAALIQDPEVRLERMRHNAELDLADLAKSHEVGAARSLNAFNLTLDNKLNIDLELIKRDPAHAFQIVDNERQSMMEIMKKFPNLDAATAQRIATEHAKKAESAASFALIDALAHQDPDTTEKRMEKGGDLEPYVNKILPEKLDELHKLPEKAREDNFRLQTAEVKRKEEALHLRGVQYSNDVLRNVADTLAKGQVVDYKALITQTQRRMADTSEAGIDPKVGDELINMFDRALHKPDHWVADHQLENDTLVAAKEGKLSELQILRLVNKPDGGISESIGRLAISSIPTKGAEKPFATKNKEATLKGFESSILHLGPNDFFGKSPEDHAAFGQFTRWYEQFYEDATRPVDEGGGGVSPKDFFAEKGEYMKRIKKEAKDATNHTGDYAEYGVIGAPLSGAPGSPIPSPGSTPAPKAQPKLDQNQVNDILGGGSGGSNR